MKVLVENNKIIKWGHNKFVVLGNQEVFDVSSRPSDNKNLCYWSGSEILLKTDEMILSDFKKYLKSLLFDVIGKHWVESTQRPNDIQDQWLLFSSNAQNWTTREQCIEKFNIAIDWLGLSEELKL
jgi:hypothetical protein